MDFDPTSIGAVAVEDARAEFDPASLGAVPVDQAATAPEPEFHPSSIGAEAVPRTEAEKIHEQLRSAPMSIGDLRRADSEALHTPTIDEFMAPGYKPNRPLSPEDQARAKRERELSEAHPGMSPQDVRALMAGETYTGGVVTPGVDQPFVEIPKPDAGGGVASGITRGAVEMIEGLETPKNTMIAAGASAMPVPIQKLIGLGFGADMMRAAPDEIQAARDAKTPGEAAEHWTRAALSFLGGGLIASHGSARPAEGGVNTAAREAAAKLDGAGLPKTAETIRQLSDEQTQREQEPAVAPSPSQPAREDLAPTGQLGAEPGAAEPTAGAEVRPLAFDANNPETWGERATDRVKELFPVWRDTEGQLLDKTDDYDIWPETPERDAAEHLTEWAHEPLRFGQDDVPTIPGKEAEAARLKALWPEYEFAEGKPIPKDASAANGEWGDAPEAAEAARLEERATSPDKQKSAAARAQLEKLRGQMNARIREAGELIKGLKKAAGSRVGELRDQVNAKIEEADTVVRDAFEAAANAADDREQGQSSEQAAPAPESPAGAPAGQGSASVPPAQGGAVDQGAQGGGATSVQHAQTEADRAARNLPPRAQIARRSDPELWDAAQQAIAADSDLPLKTLERIEKNPGHIDDLDTMVLLHRKVMLEGQEEAAQTASLAARAAGDIDAEESHRSDAVRVTSELERLYTALEGSGSAQGRAFRARRLLVDRDFSLRKMIRERMVDKGEDLTPEELSEIEKLHDQIRDLQAELDARESGARDAASNAAAAESIPALIDRVRAEAPAPEPSDPAAPKEDAPATPKAEKKFKVDKVVEAISSKANEARQRIAERRKNFSANPFLDPTAAYDHALVGAEYLAKGALSLGRFTARLILEFGEYVRPQAEEIYRQAKEMVALERSNRDLNADRSRILGAIADRAGEGDTISDLGNLARGLAENFVRRGIDEREALIDAVHGELSKVMPDLTRRQTMDAISGYGDFKPLSKDAVKVKLRELKGQMQALGKIADMEAGLPPKKSGVERREVSDAERKFKKRVHELKKLGGFQVTDPETQLRSATQAIETRLANELRDLTEEFALGKKEGEKRVAPTNARIEQLRGMIDRVRASLKGVREAKVWTPEEQIKAALEATQRSIGEYERRMREDDFGPKKKNVKIPRRNNNKLPPEVESEARRLEDAGKSKAADALRQQTWEEMHTKPSTPELEAARAKRDAVRQEYEELRQLTDEFQAQKSEARTKRLRDQLAGIDRKFKQGDIETASMLKRQLDEAVKRIEPGSKDAASIILDNPLILRGPVFRGHPELVELAKRYLAAVGNKVKLTPEQEDLVMQRDAMLKAMDELRRGPRKSDAERQIERLVEQVAEAERRLTQGDIGGKGKPAVPPLTPEAADLMMQRDALTREIREQQNALKPRKTKEELALQRWKTNAAKQEADLLDRMARGDFAAKPKAAAVHLDPAGVATKAKLEQLKLDYRRAREKDRLAKRSLSEKALEGLAKWRRAFVLSGPVTLAKLTSAAFEIGAFTPIEEAVGGVAGRVLPGLRDNAPRQGRFSWSAEAEAVSTTFRRLFSDIGHSLKHGHMDIDLLYGKPDVAPREWKDYIGAVHGALKAPARRNEFTRSFRKRIEWRASKGVDVTDAMIQLQTANEAYLDANRAIFSEDNRVVNAYKAALGSLGKPDPITGHTNIIAKAGQTSLRYLFPVVKIPTNIVARTFEYSLGSVIGAGRYARAVTRGLDKLKPDESELILRNLKRGSLGAALLLAGFFNPENVGGYYQPGEKRKDDDVKYGGLRIGGVNVPRFLVHNPLLEQLQIGATIRRVADSKLRKKDRETQGLTGGIYAAVIGLIEEVPFARETTEITKAMNPHQKGEFWGRIASGVVPEGVRWAATQMDKDAAGEVTQRKPQSMADFVLQNVPGARESVPTKEEVEKERKRRR